MMELEGRVWKDPGSSGWLVEISFLDVMTQGRTRKEALEMIKDAVMELLKDSYDDFLGKQFQLTVNFYKEGVIGMGSTDEKLLFALALNSTLQVFMGRSRLREPLRRNFISQDRLEYAFLRNKITSKGALSARGAHKNLQSRVKETKTEKRFNHSRCVQKTKV